MKKRTLSILALILVGCGGSHGGRSASTGTARYEILPRASGSTAFVFHASADGTLVFGDLSAGNNPVVWDASGNPSTFPSSTTLTMRSVSAVATDDVTFCGSATRADGTIVPVLYQSATQIDELPLPTGATSANGVGLSDDGKVALGADNALTYYDPTASHRPFLVKGGVATSLPLPTDATSVSTRGLSGDGSTVIGVVDGKPVRWVDGGAATEVSGVTALANGAAIYSLDLGYVSRDGKTVSGTISLGTGLPVTGLIPFRWTASGGAKTLPLASGTTSGVVRGLSGDGQTVLLSASETSTSRQLPYLWTESSGTRAASSRYASVEGGAAVNGTQPFAFSANGKVIAGNSVYTSDSTAQASNWRLTLP